MKDAVQVRTLAAHFATLDDEDRLPALFAGPPTLTATDCRRVESEEIGRWVGREAKPSILAREPKVERLLFPSASDTAHSARSRRARVGASTRPGYENRNRQVVVRFTAWPVQTTANMFMCCDAAYAATSTVRTDQTSTFGAARCAKVGVRPSILKPPLYMRPSSCRRCARVRFMSAYAPTGRTQVRRLPRRAVYDKAQVHAILDAGWICHVGFSVDGQPYVIPTGYARVGD